MSEHPSSRFIPPWSIPFGAGTAVGAPPRAVFGEGPVPQTTKKPKTYYWPDRSIPRRWVLGQSGSSPTTAISTLLPSRPKCCFVPIIMLVQYVVLCVLSSEQDRSHLRNEHEKKGQLRTTLEQQWRGGNCGGGAGSKRVAAGGNAMTFAKNYNDSNVPIVRFGPSRKNHYIIMLSY
jgi:hypothetical protein